MFGVSGAAVGAGALTLGLAPGAAPTSAALEVPVDAAESEEATGNTHRHQGHDGWGDHEKTPQAYDKPLESESANTQKIHGPPARPRVPPHPPSRRRRLSLPRAADRLLLGRITPLIRAGPLRAACFRMHLSRDGGAECMTDPVGESQP